MKTFSDPPPAFLPLSRGGGSEILCAALQRPRSKCPDQRRSCSPALLNCHMINQCGPSFCHFILPSAFPLLPRVIHSPLLFSPRGSPFFPSSVHFPPRVPFLSTSVSHPKASLFLPSAPPSTWVPSAMDHPSVTPLCHHSHFSPLLTRVPRCLHSYHTPCPPRWPSYPSLKLFGCARWQREKSSLSQDAELAWPFSVPRSSY
jgi:hypothetical protein